MTLKTLYRRTRLFLRLTIGNSEWWFRKEVAPGVWDYYISTATAWRVANNTYPWGER